MGRDDCNIPFSTFHSRPRLPIQCLIRTVAKRVLRDVQVLIRPEKPVPLDDLTL